MSNNTKHVDSEESSEDDSGGPLLSRRDALTGAASILGVGALTAMTSSGNAQSDGDWDAGGGDMADPAAEYRTKLYSGTLEERPSPGVPDRYWAATDARVLYRDTGDAWVVEGGLGSEDEPLPEQHVQSLSAEEEFSGKSAEISSGGPLDEVINDLLSEGYNDISVHAKYDGSRWQLDSQLFLDPTQYGGIRLDVDKHAEMDCNSGPFVFDIRPPDINSQLNGQHFEVTGGEWYNQMADPDGWLRGRDAYNLTAKPHRVDGFHNENGNARAIVAENDSQWSESWTIGGIYRADVGIDIVRASILGGSGTNSFDDWMLDSPTVYAKTAGIRVAGGLRHGSMINPTIFHDADGAVAFRLDGDLKGTSFIGIKSDNPDGYANTVGIETGADYTNPPRVCGTSDYCIDGGVAESAGGRGACAKWDQRGIRVDGRRRPRQRRNGGRQKWIQHRQGPPPRTVI